LNARPLVSDPAFDRCLVAFACSLLRLLRRNVALGQPGIQVTRMKAHAPLATDDFGDSRRRPQFGGKTERLGIFAQPGKDLAFPGRRQFGLATRMRLEGQSGIAVLSVGSPPRTDGSGVNAKIISDLGRRVAFANSMDSQASPSFEFLGRTSCSHAQVYAWCRQQTYKKSYKTNECLHSEHQ
jgi:hypothetical protein